MKTSDFSNLIPRLKRIGVLLLVLVSMFCAGVKPAQTTIEDPARDTTGDAAAVSLLAPGMDLALLNAAPFTPIPLIQGAGHLSPYDGENVENVPGIITGVLSNGKGFYMQNPVPDADPRTSEGILVVFSKIGKYSVGTLVLVSGKADEWYRTPDGGDLSITRIRRAKVTESLPGYENVIEPVLIGAGGVELHKSIIWNDLPPGSDQVRAEESPFNPDIDALDLSETAESMLVSIAEPLVVGNLYVPYGELHVVPDYGANATILTPRGGLLVRKDDFNPESVVIDIIEPVNLGVEIDPEIVPAVGDRFEGPITGIVDYAYSVYKVLPVESLPALAPKNNPRETTVLRSGPDTLTVATFNVENLGPFASDEKFADIAETIVAGLGAPDIVALQEILDGSDITNDGVTNSSATAEKLLQALAAQEGFVGYTYIDISPEDGRDGGIPGGNIRVGLLFNRNRVRFLEGTAGDALTAAAVTPAGSAATLVNNPARIAPDDPAFINSRKPLAAEFVFRGRNVVVVSNHLNSKGGDGALWAGNQPPNFKTAVQRERQAAAVNRFAAELTAEHPETLLIVAGDMNEFEFEAPMLAMKGEGVLVDLAEQLLPENERYTYVYQNNSQALDHIFCNAAALQRYGISVDIVHRYAEYPFDPENRFSDHDPIVAAFSGLAKD